MKSKVKYEKKTASKFHNTEYYQSNEYDIKNHELLEQETQRLKTDKKEKVTKILQQKKQEYEPDKTLKTIKNLYERNKKAVANEETNYFNTKLLNIVSSVPLLMIAYAKVRKNKGSVTLASMKSKKEYEKLSPEQKNFVNKTDQGADGIDIELFKETSKLIKKGKYPWGTSKRIYVDKPGRPGAKRPITIPPFMDRVVQETIRYVLVTIYEPHFDKMNCSFGFRPNRSVHDAIYPLTCYNAQGLNMALEGDIKAAYDRVNRKKLIQILGKKIKDRKFLNFIEERLKYEYYNKDKDVYVMDKEGIPQGGTDSPYLWNIYMLEFDIFVNNEIKGMLDDLNKSVIEKDIEKRKLVKETVNTVNTRKSTSLILSWIYKEKRTKGCFKDNLIKLRNTSIPQWHTISEIFPKKLNGAKTIINECDVENKTEMEIIKILQEKLKKLYHKTLNMPLYDQNTKKLRLIYSRYADDWIIITNVKEITLKKIKQKVASFLKEELYAEFSDEKTLITDMRENPAHFLGFEIKTYRGNKIIKIKTNKDGKTSIDRKKVASKIVFALPDRQRLIDKLHMKGYCNEKGFPKEITKLNNLEAFTIIEKINSVLLGLTNYYVNVIRRPKTMLSRWVYIIRYSCLKTLALKHKSTLRKIFKDFRTKEYNKNDNRTIEDTVIIIINGEKYSKTWRLYTLKSLLIKCQGSNARKRKEEIAARYWSLSGTKDKNKKNKKEKNKEEYSENFEEKTKSLSVTSSDFVERGSWINLRTKTSFELPCTLCGSEENVEMHHVKHVRKTNYGRIQKDKTWEQILGLRNRRQMPVCRSCHMHIIHKGKYGGNPLNTLSIDKMYDNRIINMESYVHKGHEKVNYKKTLEEKGWTKID